LLLLLLLFLLEMIHVGEPRGSGRRTRVFVDV
jgi:hypothetical protein